MAEGTRDQPGHGPRAAGVHLAWEGLVADADRRRPAPADRGRGVPRRVGAGAVHLYPVLGTGTCVDSCADETDEDRQHRWRSAQLREDGAADAGAPAVAV